MIKQVLAILLISLLVSAEPNNHVSKIQTHPPAVNGHLRGPRDSRIIDSAGVQHRIDGMSDSSSSSSSSSSASQNTPGVQSMELDAHNHHSAANHVDVKGGEPKWVFSSWSTSSATNNFGRWTETLDQVNRHKDHHKTAPHVKFTTNGHAKETTSSFTTTTTTTTPTETTTTEDLVLDASHHHDDHHSAHPHVKFTTKGGAHETTSSFTTTTTTSTPMTTSTEDLARHQHSTHPHVKFNTRGIPHETTSSFTTSSTLTTTPNDSTTTEDLAFDAQGKDHHHKFGPHIKWTEGKAKEITSSFTFTTTPTTSSWVPKKSSWTRTF